MIVPVSKHHRDPEGPTEWRCTTCGPVDPEHRCPPLTKAQVKARNGRTAACVEALLSLHLGKRP